MKIVVLGGYGEMGTTISIDLAETAKKFDIVIAGRNKKKADALVRQLKRKNVTSAQVDVRNKTQLKKLLQGAKVVVNATIYYNNLNVMEAALAAGASYVDLGGLYHTTLKQLKLHNKFKKAGLVAILGCGSTPGIANVLAAHGASKLDRVHAVHIQFADKDWTKYDMPFVVPYSMYTVFDEFTQHPPVFTGGRMKYINALDDERTFSFPKPVGDVPCYYSIHSELATIPKSFKDRGIRECSFRGGWDRDFIDKCKFLIDSGMASLDPINIGGTRVIPRDITVHMLNRYIPTGKEKVNDLELLRVEVAGLKNGKKKRVVVYCKTLTNRKWNISAGTWDTGVPPSVAAQMIANGKVTMKGAMAPEQCINPRYFFTELKRRRIYVFTRNK